MRLPGPTMAPRCLFEMMFATLAFLQIEGCHRSANVGQTGDAAAAQFQQAFLEAHDKKDLEAEKALVAWDDITEESKEHFLREDLQYGIETRIASTRIADIPGLNARFAATYNIPPEKFLVIVYADSRGDIQVNYPIGRKDGRYYFALFGLTREAMQRHSKQLLKNNQ